MLNTLFLVCYLDHVDKIYQPQPRAQTLLLQIQNLYILYVLHRVCLYNIDP